MRYAPASLLAVCTTVIAFGSSAAQVPPPPAWDARAAASYLDGRMSAWLAWPSAQRDHGTACVSCHTTLPYSLARPSMRNVLSETAHAAPEGVVYEQVTTRVRLWRDVEPYYPDQTRGLPKTSESRGTEAVLNAVILAARDAEAGALSDDLRQAFANLWALQMRRGPLEGGWAWLEFGLEPWEGPRSSYFGAALAAMAVGTAPGGYSATPEIQERVSLLRQYLGKGAESESLFSRLMILWAASELDGILGESQRQAIVTAALGTQRSDGGWSLDALAPWQRIDDSTLGAESDGYATALAVLALQRGGGPEAANAIERGRAWLAAHQDSETGSLPAVSINRNRDPATEPAKFMTDAATALASLALGEAR